jgi:hypothetical protein
MIEVEWEKEYLKGLHPVLCTRDERETCDSWSVARNTGHCYEIFRGSTGQFSGTFIQLQPGFISRIRVRPKSRPDGSNITPNVQPVFAVCSFLLRAKLNEHELAGINGNKRAKKEAQLGL